MLTRISISLLLCITSTYTQAGNFNLCTHGFYDKSLELAFGEHGQPITGEVICYQDKEQTIRKSKMQFIDGKPIGRQICYNKQGIPHYSSLYDKAGNITRAYNYHLFKASKSVKKLKYKCNTDTSDVCWVDRQCTTDKANCMVSCWKTTN